MCRKGVLYDAEHELRFLQDKILAKSTNFFAKILYLAKLEAEAKKTKDYVIVKENKGSFFAITHYGFLLHSLVAGVGFEGTKAGRLTIARPRTTLDVVRGANHACKYSR